MSSTIEPCLLGTVDAARFLGISRTTFWRWVKEKRDFPTPVPLSSGVKRWEVSELRAFIERRKATRK